MVTRPLPVGLYLEWNSEWHFLALEKQFLFLFRSLVAHNCLASWTVVIVLRDTDTTCGTATVTRRAVLSSATKENIFLLTVRGAQLWCRTQNPQEHPAITSHIFIEFFYSSKSPLGIERSRFVYRLLRDLQHARSPLKLPFISRYNWPNSLSCFGVLTTDIAQGKAGQWLQTST